MWKNEEFSESKTAKLFLFDERFQTYFSIIYTKICKCTLGGVLLLCMCKILIQNFYHLSHFENEKRFSLKSLILNCRLAVMWLSVFCLSLTLPWVVLQCVFVACSDHTHISLHISNEIAPLEIRSS